jgi:Fe-S cluster assembly ATPase SufC
VEYKSGGKIQQIGKKVDNTQKTRCIFEINKGCNKDPNINIDALKIVAEGFNSLRGKEVSALVITHYRRLLQYVIPDAVHIMEEGRITCSGGLELVDSLEEGGYQNVGK